MKVLTWADKWLIVALLCFSVLGIGYTIFLFPANRTQVAEILVNGEIIKTISLREGYKQEMRIGGTEHYNIIEVENGRIRVRDADCPDQVCVRTGWVKTAPQQIVCLPYRVVVRVVSLQNITDIDGITR